MLVVVLDSSTPAITAALARIHVDGAAILAERVSVAGRAHGELLAPQIAEVLDEVGAGPRDLEAVVAGVGPGPFTGLRVGLVTAAVFGQTLGVPTYGVCSLDALAAGCSGPCLVASDARRKEIYWAAYENGKRLTEPAVNRPADISPMLDRAGISRVVGVGDGALRYAEELGLPVLDSPRYPAAGALAELAAERVRARAPGEVLTPLYLRQPDAVLPAARKGTLQ